MKDSEMLSYLLPPMPAGSGADILRRFAASEGWRVDRIMGSGGEFIVEVTYLPLGCHGHLVCHPIGDDRSWDEALDAIAATIRAAIVDERKTEVMYHVGRPGEDGYMERVLQAWGIDGHNSHP